MTKLSEVGVRRRQVKRWTIPKPRCLSNILSASSLDIYEFAPHLLLLVFGMILALVLFLFEAVKWKFEKLNTVVVPAQKRRSVIEKLLHF